MIKNFQIEFPLLFKTLCSFKDNNLYVPKSNNEVYQLKVEFNKFCLEFDKEVVENLSDLYLYSYILNVYHIKLSNR